MSSGLPAGGDYLSTLRKKPMEMLDWLEEEFYVEIPGEIITTEDMNEAQKIELSLSSKYAYLNALLSYAKILTRESQRLYSSTRKPEDKLAYEDMVDKKEAIQNCADSVKHKWSAVSRAVTIKIEVNKELSMNMF